jgi:hypothetical protein
VRQQAGVVQQFASINGWLGDILETHEEELQRLPMIRREQRRQWIHDPST